MQIYNSLTKRKEEFKPIDGKTVRIYACGPTVYDLSHLGHARAFIVWDVIQRYLRFCGYDVIFVRNVTDIEDKIIKKAKEAGLEPEQVSRQYLFEFWRDMDALNVQPPDYEPRATEFVFQMIEFVQGLIKKGKAYQSNGDVYFDVPAAAKYGQLTKQNLSDMQAGSRELTQSQAELEERKRHPADFALWKSAAPHETGWPSPWGHGRPGWHLECSTMIKHVLGETIDLHGGGEDLLFPHHENEIAQSEALHDGKPLSRFWVHNSFVQLNSEKMSKSLGNFSTIRDILKHYSADEIRLFILTNHYRTPIDFSEDALQSAKAAMQRLLRAAWSAGILPASKDPVDPKQSDLDLSNPTIKKFHDQFTAAMDNDFNTSVALACLFELADVIGKTKEASERAHLADCLRFYAGVLGFTLADTRQDLSPETTHKLMNLVLDLRLEARNRKDFATSDLIRDRLSNCGINVMDTAGGATWESS